MNNKAGDKWNLEAYDETTEFPYREEFSEFLTFLCERSLCLETGCLLIHKTDRALEYLELAYDGSTKAEAQVRARLDILPGLVLGLTKEDVDLTMHSGGQWPPLPPRSSAIPLLAAPFGHPPSLEALQTLSILLPPSSPSSAGSMIAPQPQAPVHSYLGRL
ncbi:hypothetical protein ALT_3830 [Aspergillus lentulus]|uniref:Uncharacterized protein n=1 Tax=Aspergillus lentulus TaxID=293939 RepID=A0AAN4PH39_ASPLE|nr:hypothetical protein ALT_3830 [Aspergillus lentulus]